LRDWLARCDVAKVRQWLCALEENTMELRSLCRGVHIVGNAARHYNGILIVLCSIMRNVDKLAIIQLLYKNLFNVYQYFPLSYLTNKLYKHLIKFKMHKIELYLGVLVIALGTQSKNSIDSSTEIWYNNIVICIEKLLGMLGKMSGKMSSVLP
jgi:hypothetical protein